MKMFKALTASAAMAVAVLGASASHATTVVSDFTQSSAVSGGLGSASAPYGQVTVDDTGGVLAFTVTLLDNLKFRNAPDNNHFSFAFNLDNLSGVKISNITGNGIGTFTPLGSVKEAGVGNFQLAVDCTSGCGPSWASNASDVLKFTVTGSGPLTVNDLAASSTGAYFASDITNVAGSTGNIGANTIKTVTSAVPEPATWAIMLMGFGGLGAMLRQRRQQVALVRA
jgi:hypothetical protein